MAANLNPVDIKPTVKKTVNGFGSFKVALANVLTVKIVLDLATFFENPPVIIEELTSAASAGIIIIRYMEERGQIEPTSIMTLLCALKKICLSGIEIRVRKLYEEHTGRLCSMDDQSKAQIEGKISSFINSLKDKYARWYNEIQPIPYIREKVFCVNDIYVESCLEYVDQLSSFRQDSQIVEESSSVNLKSFRDIFDNDSIHSNRILLEGDPGYGKSTLTLQAAYDWCLGNVASPLKNIAVFILLPLRRLGNISSIFEAIRVVLMPPESPLTDGDILEIMRHSLSVVIVLDGYDEYPDKNSVIETDVLKMIAGNMFANIKVVVSSRSSSLPKYLDPTTITIRLTGFDEKSRDEYIKRTVTGGDQEATRHITNALDSSPILNDICQVPIFCVLFAHVVNDQQRVIKFSSVTSFFKYVIECFYSHMWKKDLKEPIHQSIREYNNLNKLAFDSLTGKTQNIAWPKHTFIDTVGNDCYEELANIGILIVDTIHEIFDEPEEHNIHHTKRSEFVRFYHKLFAEWYAARYLSSYAGSFWPFWLNYTLDDINPVDLQFVFRFACGLNKKASGRIIKYLKSVKGGASFASLCFLEQPDNPEEVDKTVKGLCSDGMIIRSSDSRLLQRSNIQLLEIASRKKIKVPCLQIDQSFEVARQNKVTLESGLSLPILLSVEKLVFTTQTEHEITQENMLGVVKYGQRCLQLKQLAFRGKYVLPLSLTVEKFKSNMNSRIITVFWQLLEYVFQLDVSSGKWRLSSTESLSSGIVELKEDVEMLQSGCSGDMTLRRTDSRLLQRAKIQLLEIASRHRIGESCLQIDHSFKVTHQNEVTLESGLSLPVLSSIEKLVFTTQTEHEISQENMLEVVKYGQRCLQLKTLAFHGSFVLPLTLTVETLKSNMNSRSIIVFWQLLEYVFQLDVSFGKWRLSSTESLTSGIVEPEEDVEMLRSVCSGGMAFRCTDFRLLQRANIQFLEIASRHKIPLSCLVLDTFREADQHSITLENGYHVPVLSTLEEVQIRTEKRIEFTQEQVVGLLCYAQQCPNLQKILFIDCLVPLCFPNDSLWPCESDKLKVLWKPREQEFDLNFTRGRWTLVSQEYLTLETKDQHSLTKMCSGTVTLHTNDTNEYHRSVILLLQIAASQQIEVPCLQFDHSFKVAQQNEVTLESGLSLPVLLSIEKLVFTTQAEHEISQENMLGVVKYGQRCLQLKTLAFHGKFILPLSLTVETLTSNMNSRNITVFWQLLEYVFQLDVSSGKWRLSSMESLTSGIVEPKEDIEMLRSVCSGDMTLRRADSRLLQRVKIQLLEIASRHRIGESCLQMDHSFKLALQNDIILESGLSVPVLSSIEKLVFTTQAEHEISQENMLGVVKYGQRCLQLKTLAFHGKFVLPLSLTEETLKSNMNSKGIIVFWTLLEYVFQLNVSSGKWRLSSTESLTSGFVEPEEDVEMLRSVCSGGMALRRTDSRLLQRANIQFLEIASRHKIPLSCLVLDTFREADQHSITLENGYHVPVLSSLEEMQIRTEKRIEFTQEQIIKLLSYAQQCPKLQKISFIDCLVPLCFPNDSLWPCESDTLKVLWKPGEQEFDLNFTRGRWTLESQEYLTLETNDQHSLTKMCSGTVTLHTNDANEYHRSVILLLQIAASQQIQITSLMLKSFSSADENHLRLESRNRVPVLPTLKELQIKTNFGKELTRDQVLGIFCYANKCQRVKKVSFIDCLLPLSLPVGSLSPFTKLHDIEVSWKPSKPDLHLDSSRGKWVLNSEEGITLETEDENSLRRLCSSVVFLTEIDSKQLQMSTILLLEIASSHNIPISDLCLEWSFSGFDGEDIRLESGLSLSSLSSLEKITITAKGNGNTLSEEEVIGLIKYGINSSRFKALWIEYCKLPSLIKPDVIPEESRSRNIKVISSGEVQFLDLESGNWRKPDDIQTITEMCSGELIIHRDTSESVQRSVIELLVEASNHDIPIYLVDLTCSFSKIDEDGNIILFSGLSLPIITSIERMTIQTVKGREMTEHEVNGILNYLQHSQRFKTIVLIDCLQPSSIPVGPSLSTLKSRGVSVFWKPDSDTSGQYYDLDLGSGLWLKLGSW
ncbi:uncharacterized protein [Apostichopus japonicus]|uniref:uncharacterized protein isoform X1 n=1 Tax=Stichopus japonicus TaxID=307972 RepID=UPI003AB4ACEB